MLVIKNQPEDWYGEPGETAEFRVEATGTGLKYQWEYAMLSSPSNTSNPIFKASTEVGSDTNTFIILVDSSRINLRLYRCAISDSSGAKLYSKVVGIYNLALKPPATEDSPGGFGAGDGGSGDVGTGDDTPGTNEEPTDGEEPESLISLSEIKQYLRIDFSDDDLIIGSMLLAAESTCMDILRTDDCRVLHKTANARPAIMYAVAYLYEHREGADHKALTLTLRSLLFGARREVF